MPAVHERAPAGRRAGLTIRNDTRHPIEVLYSPWGTVHTLPPGHRVTSTCELPPSGLLEVDVTTRSVHVNATATRSDLHLDGTGGSHDHPFIDRGAHVSTVDDNPIAAWAAGMPDTTWCGMLWWELPLQIADNRQQPQFVPPGEAVAWAPDCSEVRVHLTETLVELSTEQPVYLQPRPHHL